MFRHHTPHQEWAKRGNPVLKSPVEERRRTVMKLYRARQSLFEICQQTKLSRQTVWRIVKKAHLSRPPGGLRSARCKIPKHLFASLKLRIRLYRRDGDSFAAKAVEWLRKYHQIVVTPAAIYTWIFRRRQKTRRKQVSKSSGSLVRKKQSLAWPTPEVLPHIVRSKVVNGRLGEPW